MEGINNQHNTAYEKQYTEALKQLELKTMVSVKLAEATFELLGDYKDSKEKLEECRTLIESLSDKRNEDSKKRKKVYKVITAAAVVAVLCIVVVTVVIPYIHLNQAKTLLEEGKYDQALEEFEALNGFGNSKDMIKECQYQKASSLLEAGEYEEAIELFNKLRDYKDSSNKVDESYLLITKKTYDDAVNLMKSKRYKEAISIFATISDYEDSEAQIEKCKMNLCANAQEGDVIEFGNYNGAGIQWRVLSRDGDSILLITTSNVAFKHFQSNQNKPKYYIDSPIRDFLNESFLHEAFSDDQQKSIESHSLSTTGGDIKDKIFLLSDEEAQHYFDSDEDRKSADGKSWFLRTVNSVKLPVLNYYKPIAMKVRGDGEVYQNDSTVDYETGIRPALWLDVSGYAEN